jgi:hypothetical protein
MFASGFREVTMLHKKPEPPQPDRIRSIHGSFSWIDHRFLRQGFDQGLTRLEKLFYFVLVAVSNCDGVSFYSDERLWEVLEIRHGHELTGARNELVARDLIAFKDGVYQVLDLPPPGQRDTDLRIADFRDLSIGLNRYVSERCVRMRGRSASRHRRRPIRRIP